MDWKDIIVIICFIIIFWAAYNVIPPKVNGLYGQVSTETLFTSLIVGLIAAGIITVIMLSKRK